jgi:maleylpyruvate isomerase
MKLYSYWRSSASWRVRIALHYKGLPFEYVPVQIVSHEQASSDYAAKNPMQQVPTIELDDDGRTIHLAQSLPIIEYLEERWPSPALLPKGRVARARVRQLAECVNAGIQPFQNLPLLQIVKEQLGGDATAFAGSYNQKGLHALEALAQDTAGRFLVGDEPSLADVCLIPQLYSARRFQVDVKPFPTLTRVEAACAALPAFVAAHPDRQPDAPKEAA